MKEFVFFKIDLDDLNKDMAHILTVPETEHQIALNLAPMLLLLSSIQSKTWKKAEAARQRETESSSARPQDHRKIIPLVIKQ